MIKGERVLLRPVERDDLPLLDAWRSNVDVISAFNWFGLTGRNSNDRGFEQTGLIDNANGSLVIAALDGVVVGEIGYRQVLYGPNNGSHAYAIGLHLVPEQRGKGYGTEAQRLIARYLFETLPVMRVEASTDITNIAEQRSLEKAGFTREGVARKAQWRIGEWHDLVLYSKLRGE